MMPWMAFVSMCITGPYCSTLHIMLTFVKTVLYLLNYLKRGFKGYLLASQISSMYHFTLIRKRLRRGRWLDLQTDYLDA